MSINKLKALILLFGLSYQLQAQTIINKIWESNLHYFQNTQTYNPAFTGAKSSPSLNINYQQYKTGSLTNLIEAGFHTQLKKQPFGIGLSYKRDQFNSGIISNYLAQFAYHFQLQENIKLSTGIQLGLQGIFVDLRTLVFPNIITMQGDTITNIPDTVNDYFGNINIGAFLYSDKYYIGFSVHNLINQQFNRESFLGEKISYKGIYLSGGVLYKAHPKVALKPSMLLNLNFISSAERLTGFLDISVEALLYETLWIGTTFRPKQPFKLHVKVNIKNQVSLLGYLQKIKSIPANKKYYFLGFGLQAQLTKTKAETSYLNYF